MTLTKVMIWVAIAALVLTLVIGLWKKQHKSWLMTYLQNFCGCFFIFSGAVKAVDPLGTAYKMVDYFAEFEYTFSETAMSFITPIFPFLSNYSVSYSVIMIVLEIVIGVMLILGHQRKLTSWIFLSIIAIFTFLTGFTYLTGYVPEGVNFFQFGKWGPYIESNMKVTDCGCFGDFLKLKPKVSFFKDLFLMIPALYFVFRHKDMHQILSTNGRRALSWLTTIGVFIYCISNFVWDIPGNDFRPFRKNVNVREVMRMESEAMGNAKILAYKATNKETEQVIEIPFEQYMKEYKNYPSQEWDLEQIKEEPSMEPTKISEFEAFDEDGNDMTESILNDPSYSFMIVAYKFDYEASKKEHMVQDSVFNEERILVDGRDTTVVPRSFKELKQRKVIENEFEWSAKYVKPWVDVVNPFLEQAEKDGFNTYALTKYEDYAGLIDAFRHKTQSAYPFYQADDILLKTIVRSNPGILLMKDGLIIDKWHYKKLPTYDIIKEQYLK